MPARAMVEACAVARGFWSGYFAATLASSSAL